MIKKSLLTISALTLGLNIFSVSSSHAATGNASANIVSAATVQEALGGGLNFGDIIVGSSLSKVYSDGTVTNGGDAVVNGTPQHGQFEISNVTVDDKINIVVDETVTLYDGSNNSMTADLFVNDTGSNTTTITATNTLQNFEIQGELTVPASQASGDYTGTYEVVAYFLN